MQALHRIIQNRAKAITALAFLAIGLALAIPSANGNLFVMNMVVMIFIYAILTSAWNIIGGYAGQLSLGHASFFGIGAYTVVLLNIKQGISPWLGLIVAIIIAVAGSSIVGWPCFKLKGPFFALSTVAVGEVMRVMAINLTDLTYGSVGISVDLRFGFANMLFREKWAYLILAFSILAVLLLIIRWIESSKLGYYLVAIREDQDAAASLGVNATKAKLISFAISAAFTAIGGALYAQYILYIDPASVLSANLSLQMVIMAVVGGLGTMWGPLLGAVLMVPLDQFIRAYLGGAVHGLNLVIYSLVLIAVILIIPRGIWPTLSDWIKKNEKSEEQGQKGRELKNEQYT